MAEWFMRKKATGLSQEALHGRLAGIIAAGKASGGNWRVTKARCFAAQALEQSIDVSPPDWRIILPLLHDVLTKAPVVDWGAVPFRMGGAGL